MANIRDLKKDINYVLGDIIESVYLVEQANNKPDSKEGAKIIDNAIEIFDSLISKVNQRDVENRPSHLKSVRKELEKKGEELIEQLSKLS